MNKTIKVNLGGFVFQLDEDAYEQLRLYLVKLEKRFENTSGGKEIVEDIESRIAELLQGKLYEGKEVISLKDVKDVIGLMGEPDDYMDEEGEPVKSSSKPKEKLYRENKNAIIGGVAGGLATYFGINAVWVRLVFLLTVFAWTTGFWVYVILWIVLPKRKITLYHPDNKEMSPFENLLNNIFLLIGKVFRFILRFISVVLGLCLILAGFPLLVAMVGVSVFPVFHWFNWGGLAPIEVIDFVNFAIPSDSSAFVMVLVMMVMLIPVLLITYWGIRLLLMIKVRDAWLHVTAGLVWIGSVVLLGMFCGMNATMFAENEEETKRVELSVAPDTLWIMMGKPIDREYYNKSIGIPDKPIELYYNEKDEASCALVYLEIYNSSDSMAYFEVEKNACGSTRSQAWANIGKIKYDYVCEKNHLVIDEGFACFAENHPWLPSWVEVEVYVPKNTVLVVDKRLKQLGEMERYLHRLDNKVIYKDYE